MVVGRYPAAHYRDRAPIDAVPAMTNSVTMRAQLARMRNQWKRVAGGRPSTYVAHSAGGLLVLGALAQYPDMVGSIVLVDPTHPEQLDRSAKQLHSYLWHRQFLGLRAMNPRRYVKLTEEEIETFGRLPRTEQLPAREARERRSTWINAYRESRELQRSWTAYAGRTDVTHVPIRVLVSEAANAEDPVYVQLLEELVGRSTNGRLSVVPDTEHESIVTDQNASQNISDAIDELLGQTQTTRGSHEHG
jgi:pimeloyl-ACP methyl ester carboxylesterase